MLGCGPFRKIADKLDCDLERAAVSIDEVTRYRSYVSSSIANVPRPLHQVQYPVLTSPSLAPPHSNPQPIPRLSHNSVRNLLNHLPSHRQPKLEPPHQRTRKRHQLRNRKPLPNTAPRPMQERQQRKIALSPARVGLAQNIRILDRVAHRKRDGRVHAQRLLADGVGSHRAPLRP